jgi:aryl-phospho-beta-D-glucosidase BglC (GH1 family)
MTASCEDSLGENTIVGEWSLAVRRDVEWNDAWSPVKQENHVFYRKWCAAQVKAYEKGRGWVFWSWKTELGGDWRWSYRAAVEAGVVPRDVARARARARDGCV